MTQEATPDSHAVTRKQLNPNLPQFIARPTIDGRQPVYQLA